MASNGKSYADAAAGKPGNTKIFGKKIRCLNCAGEGSVELTCKEHRLCQKCLTKNAHKYGIEEMYTCPADECSVAAAPSLPVWIYVDNSNIWIGAKYLANKEKHFKSSQDHRVRISIGNLTDVVAKSREVKMGTLYGSEPPQIDSVWEKIRKHKHWTVKTKKKSFLTHKEKEVDAQLLVDVTEVACTTPPAERSTIILITGDADMCPAVEKILNYDGWKVEIYMWKHSLSDRLKALSKRKQNVMCEPLDNHLMDVVFTNNKFPAANYPIPADSSAVLEIKPDSFPKRVIDSDWWKQLESIAQWPVQYWWLINDDKVTDDLLLVFGHQGEKEKYNVSNFVKVLSDEIAADAEEPSLPHVERSETYIDYKKRLKTFEAVLQCGNFKASDVGNNDSNFVLHRSHRSGGGKVIKYPCFKRGHHVVDEYSTSTNSSTTDGQFSAVPPTKVGGKIKECYLGKNCIRGLKCEFKHLDSDMVFFESNKGMGMPNRKTRLCKKYPSCHRDASECNYAHGDGDGWCLTCRRHGHFMPACPKKNEWQYEDQ